MHSQNRAVEKRPRIVYLNLIANRIDISCKFSARPDFIRCKMHPDPIDLHAHSVYLCVLRCADVEYIIHWGWLCNCMRGFIVQYSTLYTIQYSERISFRFGLLYFVVHNILTHDVQNGSWCEWTCREGAKRSKWNEAERERERYRAASFPHSKKKF